MYKFKIFLIWTVIIISINCICKRDIQAVKKSSDIYQKKAPDFSLFDINKKVYRLSKFTNIVILNFFATWCPPCKIELPHLVELSKEYKKKGVRIIGILLEKKYDPEKINKFIKDYKINYPVLIGTSEVISDYNDVRAIPTTVIINEKGFIVVKHPGYMDKKNLKELIERTIRRRDIRKGKQFKKKSSN